MWSLSFSADPIYRLYKKNQKTYILIILKINDRKSMFIDYSEIA